MIKFHYKKFSQILFRLAIAGIFLYFVYLSVTDPITTGNQFIAPWALDIVTKAIDLKIFVVAFGVVQIAVALAIVCKVFLKYALLAAALMLVGIITSLGIYHPTTGINELALRDIVILTGIIYLFSQTR